MQKKLTTFVMYIKKCVMKTIAILCFFSIFVGFNSFAQSEKKVWAKKLKEMDPMEFKKIMESYENTQKQITDLNTQLETTKSNLQARDLEIIALKAELDKCKSQKQNQDVDPVVAKVTKKGVIFKVQIGAFKNKDLIKYFDNNPHFSGDIDRDGTKKYTLGYFSDYWEADVFKKYLREMGVKDAWIVAYKGKKRLKIKEVLEGIIH